MENGKSTLGKDNESLKNSMSEQRKNFGCNDFSDVLLDYRKKMYSKYAESYHQKFRALLDFQEPPRQFIGIICLVLCCISGSLISRFYLQHNLLPSDVIVIRFGACGLIVVMTLYCFFQTRDGLLIRPHPGFWRIIHAICLCHLTFMFFLAVIPVEKGREIVQKALLGPNQNHSYIFADTLDLNCQLSLKTMKIQMSKIWFYSHIVGYFAKMIILRDWSYCLFVSITFEFVELSLQWLIPEFRECWWDSIILDVSVSNVLGMCIGAFTLKLIDCLPYSWFTHKSHCRNTLTTGVSDDLTEDKQQQLFAFRWYHMLLPYLWSEYHWNFFQTPERLIFAIIILFITLLTESNVFLLMYAMDIPAMHIYHKIRVTYMCFLAVSAVAETYQFINDGLHPTNASQRRIGPNSWLYLATILVETYVLFYYMQAKLDKIIIKMEVVIVWLVSFSLFAFWCFCHFVIVGPERLDVSKPLWKKCYDLTALCDLSKLGIEEDLTDQVAVEESYSERTEQLPASSQTFLADGDAFRALVRLLFSVKKNKSQTFSIESRKELTVFIKTIIKRRKKWKSLYTVASYIVDFPALMSFLPVVYLFRYYKFD